MLGELIDDAAALAEVEDPLDAELAGAFFVALSQSGGDDEVAAFAGNLVPAIEARGTRASSGAPIATSGIARTAR